MVGRPVYRCGWCGGRIVMLLDPAREKGCIASNYRTWQRTPYFVSGKDTKHDRRHYIWLRTLSRTRPEYRNDPDFLPDYGKVFGDA